MTAGVEVDDLRVQFGAVSAVCGVSFSVVAGSATALLGRNGAGRSTTMRVLAAVVPPTSGRALVAAVDLVAHPLEAKRVVGYCPDVGGLIPRATPWDHLQLSARRGGCRTGSSALGSSSNGSTSAGRPTGVTAGFSHGMGRRMSVALAVFHEPAVLLLDEPFDGVDPTGVDATSEAIAEARARGAAVLVSTHLRDLAVAACDRAVVLLAGRTVASVPAEEMAGECGDRAYRALLG